MTSAGGPVLALQAPGFVIGFDHHFFLYRGLHYTKEGVSKWAFPMRNIIRSDSFSTV